VVAGLALQSWSSWHDVAKLAVIGTLLAVTGPATVVAAGQAVHRGTPDRGTPDRGTPDRGTPDRGTPEEEGRET
jgi:hypothetical protein